MVCAVFRDHRYRITGQENNMNRVSTIASITVALLLGGCATSADVAALKSDVNALHASLDHMRQTMNEHNALRASLEHAQKTADASMAKADFAANEADRADKLAQAADSQARQALAAGKTAEAEAKSTSEKLDQVFRKTMMK
jgi:outer membrane murein-binding lipoprotein Lpp